MDLPKLHTQQLPNGFSFDLIRVEAGSFFFGGSGHEIQLPTFYMAKYPVTQSFWQAVMGEESPAYFKGAHRPVECVSWYDAAAFCNALNEQCEFSSRYFADENFNNPLDYSSTRLIERLGKVIPVYIQGAQPGYQLPTESAWEYAAIGAQAQAQFEYAGGNNLDELGWYNKNSHNQNQSVGLKQPNELGIHDLSGNVWEWCEDQFQGKINQIPNDGSAWLKEKAGVSRIIRGGSWSYDAWNCRSSNRRSDHPADRESFVGFRVALLP